MALHCKTPQDVAEAIRDHNILFVDVKFTDLYGQWHHFSMPIEEVDIDALFVEGHGFDGSSIRGFKTIESSDMNLIADPTTAMIDPVCAMPTLSLICDVVDPISGEAFSRDPRNVARKALAYLRSTGIAVANCRTNASNRSVKPLPGAAHGTSIIRTPSCGHWMRGVRKWIYVLYWKKFRCRQVLSTVS